MARFVPELPLKLVIIDESIVMFGMEDPVAGSSELTIMVVDHPSLASILKIAFNTVWQNGLTFEQAYEELVFRRPRTASAFSGAGIPRSGCCSRVPYCCPRATRCRAPKQ